MVGSKRRVTPGSFSSRKFYFNENDIERILEFVRPHLGSIARRYDYREKESAYEIRRVNRLSYFKKNPPRTEEDIKERDRLLGDVHWGKGKKNPTEIEKPSEKARKPKMLVPIPNLTFRDATGKATERKGHGFVDGKPSRLKTAFPGEVEQEGKTPYFIEMEIPNPRNRKDIEKKIASAKKHLNALRLDKRFKDRYLKTLRFWMNHRLLRELDQSPPKKHPRKEGRFLDELDDYLHRGVRGSLLYGFLIHKKLEPGKVELDPEAQKEIDERLQVCQVKETEIEISGDARAEIIRRYCKEENIKEFVGLKGRLQTRRRRKT